MITNGKGMIMGIAKILIVDDEKVTMKNLEHVMKNEGYEVIGTESGQNALKLLDEYQFDVILTDIRMEEVDGIQILKRCRELYPDTEVIMITGYASLESAIHAMKQGAFYYIAKPFKLDEVRKVVKEAVEKVKLKKENIALLDVKSSLEHAVEEAVGKLYEKQAQLIAAEKLAILGTFAAGVAHEINNPLAIINEKAGLMKDILEMSENCKHKTRFLNLLDAIFESVNRCQRVTHRILGFARKTEVSIEIFDLNDLIKYLTVFLEKEIFYKNIRLELNLKENLPEVRSDKGQLQQVFLNIIKNAIDAVENGGLVAVSTDIKDENMVKVSIKDNGHGISGEDLKHMFEPFFTTKEKGKGTGLGLSITYGIVKNLGGNILVESEVNKGTTFIVEIPTNSELAKGEVV
jgi:signal transduction histidine kinase